ncbi:DNA translocase FtsK [Tropicibacter oceani]|uniref:DNA translocase FtsK n=1 Tax=Tropicibacter oceani TaxID=3058420 RepID=A0ABY8QK28_9RHOB|nr:DNA translocase FtsK [Tropicibacter oceani]WGW04979.1 DNA translocase FtsK 4TM domain-containing protein [Tropicibacter oceani]
MASYQTRGRDPLFDTNTAMTLEKRGRELLGIALVIVGLMAAAMIASYTPEDPSFMTATDAPVQNWMGRIGASIAAPLFMIIGWGSWAVALTFLVWGGRLALHREEVGALSRLIFAPIWIALCSVYASGLHESTGWSHNFGLGGLFGDMMMGSLLNLLPVDPGLGLKLVQLLLGIVIVVFGAFVLGFTRTEIKGLARFLMLGVVMAYASLLAVLGRSANGAMGAASKMQSANAERRARKQAEAAEAAEWAAAQKAVPMPAAPRVRRPETAVATGPMPSFLEEVADAPEPPEKTSFLSRMPALIKRGEAMPEPEMVETVVDHDVDAPGADRVKAKIADVIRARRRDDPMVATKPAHDPSKPLTKGRGHGPLPLIFKPAPTSAGLPPEPPLTGAARAAIPAEPPLTAAVARTVAAAGAIPQAPSVSVAPRADPQAPAATAVPQAPQPAAAPMVDAYADMRDFDDYGDDDVHIYEDDEDEAMILDDAAAPQPAARSAVPPMPEPKKVVQQPVRKPIQPSKRAQAEAQPQLKFEERHSDYELPPLGLLMPPDQIERHVLSDEALEENARMLESVLDDYGVKGEIVSVRPGPVVTMYELEPAPGLKASRVIGLADDIARSMSALSARVSTVPGRSVIGIELPNDNREMVSFREILAGRDYGDGKHALPLALGKDIGGEPVVANLAKMPHLLIAGTTGSGKSVAINTMILSLLYKLSPEELRLVMIDPKMLELSVYDGIPHLLSPVVTDPKKAVVALKWVVGEMEDRYRKMSKMGVRNIDGYNSRVADALKKGEMFSRTVQTGFDDETGEPVFETDEFEPKKMPYIVVIVDEMADLMMVAGKEIEACIQRLAQMARASGIHLVMATQRPSVDVITGTIKANFPTRISFQVTSKIDSRTILGEMGAEQLLGMGDMLYMAGGSKITRCHGPFVSDEEVEEIVNHLKAFGPPEYVSGVVQGPDDEKADNIDAVLGLNTGGNTGGEDALYDQAVAIVIKDRKCSTSYIQRKLGIGYNKAARLVEQMEDEMVVSSANHVGKREILVPEQQ